MPSLLDKTLQRVQTKCFWSNFSKPRAHPQDRLELLSALLQFAGSPAAEPAEAGISLGAGTRRSGGPGPPLPNGAPPAQRGPPAPPGAQVRLRFSGQPQISTAAQPKGWEKWKKSLTPSLCIADTHFLSSFQRRNHFLARLPPVKRMGLLSSSFFFFLFPATLPFNVLSPRN